MAGVTRDIFIANFSNEFLRYGTGAHYSSFHHMGKFLVVIFSLNSLQLHVSIIIGSDMEILDNWYTVLK